MIHSLLSGSSFKMEKKKTIHDAPKHMKSFVWKHFGFYQLPNTTELDKTSAICRVCKVALVYRTGTTSNLSKHLDTKHPHLVKSDSASVSSEKRKVTCTDGASTNKETEPTPSTTSPISKKSKTQMNLQDCYTATPAEQYSLKSGIFKKKSRAIAVFMFSNTLIFVLLSFSFTSQ